MCKFDIRPEPRSVTQKAWKQLILGSEKKTKVESEYPRWPIGQIQYA